MALKDVQNYGDTHTKFFAVFTVTDTPTGSPVFYWSDAHFNSNNQQNGIPTASVIADWGDLPERLGTSAASETSIWVFLDKWAIPSNGTSKRRVEEWLRILQLRGVTVSIYLWNVRDLSQELLWQGHISGLGERIVRNGTARAEIVLSTQKPGLDSVFISDVVNKTDFANASQEAVGEMIPRVYGSYSDTMLSGGNRNEKGTFGFPMPGVRGVIVDENQATAKVTIRFSKNTAAGWTSFVEHSGADAPFEQADLWVYDPSMNAYGLVDGDSYTAVSDATKTEVVVDRSPGVWFFIRPSEVGPANAAAFTDIYKLINSNAEDYVESTVTDFIWAFNAPAFAVNGDIVDARIFIDFANLSAGSRTIRWGLWATQSAAYHSAQHDEQARASALGRVIWFGGQASSTGGAGGKGIYTYGDFGATDPNFKEGKLLSISGGVVSPSQLRCEVVSASKDGVRLYHMVLCVKVQYPWVPLSKGSSWWTMKAYQERANKVKYDNPGLYEWLMKAYRASTPAQQRREAIERLRGTDFFARGITTLSKLTDIAEHLINDVSGKATNTTAATFGNFTDPQTYGVTANLDVLARFGSEPLQLEDCLESLEGRFPVSFFEDEGTWLCIPDDMNPHSSRFYRSTSELVDVTAEDIEEGSFSCAETPQYGDLVNQIDLAFSHGHPDRDAGFSYLYNHPVSQQFFGVRKGEPVEEPWIAQNNLQSAAGSNATDFAKWLGRKDGWPRLRPSFRVRQKFYDLKRGHVVRLRDLEDRGIYCPAFRCGLLLHHFASASATTSLHDGGAYIAGAGTSEMYLGFGQQVSQVDFDVLTAATYTNVANPWQYLDVNITWQTLSNQVNPQAIKTTGLQTASFTAPSPWLWTKQEVAFGGSVVGGPCYWLRMQYNTATGAGASNNRTGYPAQWYGRLFEVLDVVTVPPSSPRDYPVRSVTLREVM